MIAPLGALANALARVVPDGETINNILAEAELPSKIALVNPSKDFRSPKNASQCPRP